MAPNDDGLTVYENLEQGTDEWLEARRGIITASVIGQLITPKTMKLANNDTSRDLVRTLAAERITGRVHDTGKSWAMLRGHLEEPFAKEEYIKHKGIEGEDVGFMVREFNGHKMGFSPDMLVEDDGFIEVKSRDPKKHIQTIVDDNGVPPENMAQIQGGFFVSQRDWCDFVSYSNGMHLWIKRVFPILEWQYLIQQAVEATEEKIQATMGTFLGRVHDLPIAEYVDHFDEEPEFF